MSLRTSACPPVIAITRPVCQAPVRGTSSWRATQPDTCCDGSAMPLPNCSSLQSPTRAVLKVQGVAAAQHGEFSTTFARSLPDEDYHLSMLLALRTR